MSLWQAIWYFVSEALRGMRRSWGASTVAIFAISISLFVGAFFVLVTGNLGREVDRFRDRLRINVYLNVDASDADVAGLVELLEQPSWVRTVDVVTPEQGRDRLRQTFPEAFRLLGEGEEVIDLPPVAEIGIDPGNPPQASELAALMEEAAALPVVELIDDDREWLGRLVAVVTVVRLLGLSLGAGLLVAATFTIASVVRLTAFIYREEIDVLRLVGATEFFVRGPLYATGLVQGLFGGVLALATLGGCHAVIASRSAETFWAPLVFAEFLGWRTQLLIIVLGASAGLFGAVVSVRREPPGTTS